MKVIPFATNYKVDVEGNVYARKGKMTPIVTGQGYLRLKLHCDNGDYKAFLVHRLVAMTYIPNPENKKEVNHINGIKSDNRLVNLEWNTRTENQKHSHRTGLRSNHGEGNPRSILTNEQVIEIYFRLSKGERACDVAPDYPISQAMVEGIRVKNCWKELLSGYPDIPRKKRSEVFSTNTIKWIANKLQEGVGLNQILKLSRSKYVTEEFILKIKNREVFAHITKDYNW